MPDSHSHLKLRGEMVFLMNTNPPSNSGLLIFKLPHWLSVIDARAKGRVGGEVKLPRAMKWRIFPLKNMPTVS